MDELVDMAMKMNYLHEGGKITLTFEAADNNWIEKRSSELDLHLHQYLDDKISVDIEITNNVNNTNASEMPEIIQTPDVTPTSSDSDNSGGVNEDGQSHCGKFRQLFRKNRT